MAKDLGGNDDSYEKFYPSKLKIELNLDKNWPRDGSRLVATLVYDGKLIGQDSVWLDHTVIDCCHG
jgi:hypothetical protein